MAELQVKDIKNREVVYGCAFNIDFDRYSWYGGQNECEMKSGVWVDTVKSIFETNAVIVMENGEVITLPTSRVCGVDTSVLMGKR